MGSLRERVVSDVDKLIDRYEGPDPEEVADAAIAAFAEALLSPEAVAKGAEQLIWLLKDGVLPYADQPEDEQVDAAQAVIEDLNATLLTAIGAQPAKEGQ